MHQEVNKNQRIVFYMKANKTKKKTTNKNMEKYKTIKQYHDMTITTKIACFN